MKKRGYWGIGALLTMVSLMLVGNSAWAYDRYDTVAEEEFQKDVFAPGSLTEAEKARAWRRINGICYNGSGEKIEGAITRGIDVSEWQDTIDWKKVKNSDVDFAFVRISSGTNYIDKKYAYNMVEAEKANMPVGTYVYSTATTPEQALAEAKLAIEKMDGYKVSYPVVYDLEYSKMGDLTPTEISRLAVTFCNEVKKAGYYPMIYSNTNWYDNKIDWSVLTGVDMWLARYGDTILAPSRSKYKYTIWQCTDGDGGGTLNPTKGLIDGIPIWNNIDLNFGYVDYTKIIEPRWHALSSYDPSDSVAEPVVKNGWVEENGKTYYYRNGEKLKGLKYIGGKSYRFDSVDGYLYRDVMLYSKVTKNYQYVDENGIRVSNKWITYQGNTYYFGKDGTAYKGSRYVGRYFYLFDSNTAIAKKNYKFVYGKNNILYYDADGKRCRNKFVSIRENGRTNTYYFGNDGKAYKGIKIIGGKKYYFYTDSSKRPGVRAENTTIRFTNGLRLVLGANGICTRQYYE